MIPRSLPARITWGFAILLAVTALLGLASILRILAISGTLSRVADNSLPSVVTLNRIMQSAFTATRDVRRLLLQADDAAAPVDTAAFERAVRTMDEQMAAYDALISDPEDGRLFAIVREARAAYLAATAAALDHLRAGRLAEARATMRDVVDPAFSRYVEAVDAFREAYRSWCFRAGVDYVPLDTSMQFDKALMEYLISRRNRF